MPIPDRFAARRHPRRATVAALATLLLTLAACAPSQPPGAAASTPATPLSGAAPLTLERAKSDAFVAQYGIEPDSPKAAIIARWREKMLTDPDIVRAFGMGDGGQAGRSLAERRPEFFSEGSLRVSQSDRSTFISIGARVLDAAPPDCGGEKSMSAVIVRYLSLARLSDQDIDDYFRITYESLKRSAQQTPMATVNEPQREQGRNALSAAIAERLKGDPDAARSLAAAVADPAAVTPEIWCSNMRTMEHAVLSIPQPQRDWLLISIQTDALARRSANLPVPRPPSAP
ncbi:TonB C-terminal domain-containing protein [Burkholderia gladioli]|uniref:TonB C-terminal domain-containing protein n=1 Tax=Burkholderia gladioli TaxID=28095 RepID=UPI00163E001E|nr:TonB C-terminal domain-containing protein [Burkholderia gladioli]